MHDMAQCMNAWLGDLRTRREPESSQEWLGDAGKIKAMSNALADIEITPDDPTPS